MTGDASNADPQVIDEIVENYKVVAVVGLSPKPDRPSYRVAEYLKQHGYRIIPVNPGQREILGEKCYPSLKDIPFPVEVADIFRNVEAIQCGCSWAWWSPSPPAKPGRPACKWSWTAA